MIWKRYCEAFYFFCSHVFSASFLCWHFTAFIICTLHNNKNHRAWELAAAEDRLTDLERQKDDIMRFYSPAALLDKLQSRYSEQ
jgi:hypothetical protein